MRLICVFYPKTACILHPLAYPTPYPTPYPSPVMASKIKQFGDWCRKCRRKTKNFFVEGFGFLPKHVSLQLLNMNQAEGKSNGEVGFSVRYSLGNSEYRQLKQHI